MNKKNEIRIFKTTTELAEATATFMIGIAENAVKARGRFVISLSGGHTPEQLYILLSKPPFRDQMPWNRTFVFWGDERCVPANDKENNAHMARELLFDNIEIPPSNIYAIPVDREPLIAAEEYEQTIKQFFKEDTPRFDFVLLGLGTNGHTASLFPGNSVVFDNTRLVRETYVAEQKMFRITMTAALINDAYNIIFLVAGKNKADILNTIINGPYEPGKYPAQLISPVDGNLCWYADSEAAALLPAHIN